jgi:5-enolpyruvylshikimate-3-phosphate synthase
MKQDPLEITRLWVAQLDERINWLDQAIPDMDVGDMVRIVAEVTDRRKALDAVLSDLSRAIANGLDATGTKTAQVDGLFGDTLTVEVKSQARRTEVKRDELMDAVQRAPIDAKVNSLTGEIETVTEARLRTLKECFRLEPRWSELKKLGIDPDEYAHTTWTPTVKVDKVKKL